MVPGNAPTAAWQNQPAAGYPPAASIAAPGDPGEDPSLWWRNLATWWRGPAARWVKWQLSPDPHTRSRAAEIVAGTDPSGPDAQAGPVRMDDPEWWFERGQFAVVVGNWDEAQQAFDQALRRRDDARYRTGLADVLAAGGNWQQALGHYQQAARLAPADLVPVIGIAHALAASGSAADAEAILDGQLVSRPADPILAYYLARVLLQRTADVRSLAARQPSDQQLVITSQAQVVTCEQLAYRVLEVSADVELAAAAETVLSEVAAARRWIWSGRTSGQFACFAAMVLASGLVAGGGLTGNVLLFALGLVAGAGSIFMFVVRQRRPAWQFLAEEAEPVLVRRGI